MFNHQSVLSSIVAAAGIAAAVGLAGTARAQSFVFATNDPDLKMAVASRPEAEGVLEIEAADDFVLTSRTRLSGARFIGLIPQGSPFTNIQQVVVEIYRVFPFDSDTTRTPHVPTRVNSPSDVAFETRDSEATELAFIPAPFGANVTALNSVINGINPSPDQTTHGEGAIVGDATAINVQFIVPIDLPPGHYFFIPQVVLNSGSFQWLSAPKPIVAPGTPFVPDLQAWVRNSNLDPDWLRIGTDIVGGSPAPTFNMAFKLNGTEVCSSDFNFDGYVNGDDFDAYTLAFINGGSAADFDGNGFVNGDDFDGFVAAFVSGC